jgi:hypothetical protein
LQSTHADDKTNLDHAEVDNSSFGAADSGKVSVFAGSEVLLVSVDGRELARDLEDGLLKGGCLFGGGTLLGGELGAGFVLDSNLEVDVLLGKSTHLVVEAEGVVADDVGGEDEVALSLLFTIQNNLAIGTLNNVVDIERTTRLDLK